MELRREFHLAIFAGGVEFKGMADKWSMLWVTDLGFSSTSVKIAQRGGPRIKALLKPAVKTLLNFLSEIAAVVRGNDRLYVSRKHAARRSEVQGLGCEVNLNA